MPKTTARVCRRLRRGYAEDYGAGMPKVSAASLPKVTPKDNLSERYMQDRGVNSAKFLFQRLDFATADHRREERREKRDAPSFIQMRGHPSESINKHESLFGRHVGCRRPIGILIERRQLYRRIVGRGQLELFDGQWLQIVCHVPDISVSIRVVRSHVLFVGSEVFTQAFS